MRILVSMLCLFLLIATKTTAKIVFSARHEGIMHIYVMEDDGTGVMSLTTANYLTNPRWSPDGKQIVFSRQVHPEIWNHRNIVMMDADGTNVRHLTEPHDGMDLSALFSPDGTAVLFSGYERMENKTKNYIRRIELESGKIKELAELDISFPDMSPDGKRIVFSTIPTLGKTGSELWIMDADGHNPRELLPPPRLELPRLIDRGYAKWSPDGKKILYYEYESRYNAKDGFIPLAHRYFIYDLATRQLQELRRIPKTYRCSTLDWMDNGKSIVFSAVKMKLNVPVDGLWHPYHLYKYHIATGTTTQLTEQTWENPSLDWISDDVLPVSSKGKQQTQWGALKSSLPTYRETFKAFVQSVSVLLLNQR